MKNRTTRTFLRLAACSLCGILLAFLIYGIKAFAYDIRYRMAQSKEPVITAAELEEMIQKNKILFLEEDAFLQEKLKKDYYTNCSQDEQLEILAHIGALEAEHLGIPTPEFRLSDLREDLIGYYDHKQQQLVLNVHFLSIEKHAIQTVIHEMFHTYQYACIEEVTTESTLLWAREIEAWRENAAQIESDFDSKEGIVNYYTSAMEESAREYMEKRQVLYFPLVDADNNNAE